MTTFIVKLNKDTTTPSFEFADRIGLSISEHLEVYWGNFFGEGGRPFNISSLLH